VNFKAQNNIFYSKKSPSLEQFLPGSATKNRKCSCPRWPKQVKTLVAVAGIIANKYRQNK
jgi:hypothetical protein